LSHSTNKKIKTILYVRLPCWKIYPGGVIYVADYIHKQHPEIKQELLDLAIVPIAERKQALKSRILALNPDMVAFSWRNMQSSSRFRNFAFMKLVRKLQPESKIIVGGTAVSIFGKYVIKHCPVNTIVAVGEGEPTMLSIINGESTTIGECYCKDNNGVITYSNRTDNFNLSELSAVNFEYIESIFPEIQEYTDDYIGVHTKRGCPYQCHFCLYNRIEGHQQRYRDPIEIVNEIESLSKRYGVKKIWFTDAQFCSTRRSTTHVEEILDEIIRRKLKIEWTGYLRLNYLTKELAKKMLDSGLASLDLSFTGTQEVINSLTLGYSLEQQMEAFQMFKDAGYTNQKVKLYIPLNAPGETRLTLQKTIDRIKDLYQMFGRDNVLPFIFFIGIQPGTPVEKLLIKQGYLNKNYNPLTFNPFIIKKLLYNPKPLGKIIARSYLEAASKHDKDSEYIGRATMDIIERELGEDFVDLSIQPLPSHLQ
jgi:radical SAM superfamily enzyme YgiQ (UPF0313 family)